MRLLLTAFILFPTLAQASVGEDIQSLLDRFFGAGQEPVQEVEPTPMVEPDLGTAILPVTTPEIKEIQQEIMRGETKLETFEAELRAEEIRASELRSQALTSQQQLQLLDQQMSLNARKLGFYRPQADEWEEVVERLTREKSVLRAQIRILERENQDFLSKKFIQKQNFQLNPTTSWWQWLFSDKSVSQLLSERKQVSVEQQERSDGLAQLERLKTAFDAQEREAVNALGKVSRLKEQLAKEQIVLRDLADGKATILARIKSDESVVAQRLSQARQSQADITEYLQDLRQQLRDGPQVSTTKPEVTLQWPLESVTLSVGFKDEAYKKAFGREHLGVDLVASQGTDVLAAGEGVVNKVATDGTGYTYIILQHGPELYTVYGHLSKTLVEEDDPVAAGDVIAWSGGTPGTSGAGYFTSGPHLHFEVFSGGVFVDPLKLLQSRDAWFWIRVGWVYKCSKFTDLLVFIRWYDDFVVEFSSHINLV